MTKIAASDHQKVADLYTSGMTQEAVAAEFGVTKGCVYAILKRLGIGRIDGGRAIRSFANTSTKVAAGRAKNERTEARIRATWGLSLDDYRAHVVEYGSSADRSSPMGKYLQQRMNAGRRGIAWQFTFAEWWRVWQESGKWGERGRGQAYVMARYGDGDTPYSTETVYICTAAQNSKDGFIVSPAAARFSKVTGSGCGWTFRKGQTKNPYQAQLAGKALGSYPTPELARAAYLAAVERSQP